MHFLLDNFFTAAIFISPSLQFLVFGYGPPYLMATLYLAFRFGDFEDSHFVTYAT